MTSIPPRLIARVRRLPVQPWIEESFDLLIVGERHPAAQADIPEMRWGGMGEGMQQRFPLIHRVGNRCRGGVGHPLTTWPSSGQPGVQNQCPCRRDPSQTEA